jgi:hypothetical protein
MRFITKGATVYRPVRLDMNLGLIMLRAMDNQWVVWIPGIGALLALCCLIAALRDGKRKRLMDDLPVSKTAGVFIGLVELEGTAESGKPLISYLTEDECVYYAWEVRESWSRLVTETSTDNEGHTHTTTRTESGWKTVAQDGDVQPFYLQDDTGLLLVRPDGAQIEPVTVLQTTCGTGDPLYYGKGPESSIMDSDYRRMFIERAIPLHRPIYVMGHARERQDMVAAEIAVEPTEPAFLISIRTKEQVSSGLGWAFWGWLIFGFVLAVAGCIVRDAALSADVAEHWPIYAAAAFGYLAAYALGWSWMVFNSLVGLRQRVQQAWSAVDVQLRRRHDLIPNLVNAVQGFRDYEKNLQTELATMRSQLTATPPGVTGPDYRAVTQTVIAVAERYPELKASDSFVKLQQNLIDTEQRIALARGYFNSIATFFNTRLEVVPDRYIAALGVMKLQTLMEANDFERAPVKVDLAKA